MSGIGGVGKTFLVSHVISQLNMSGSGFLRLSCDGLLAEHRGSFVDVLESRLAPTITPAPARQNVDHFRRTRRFCTKCRALVKETTAQLKTTNETQEVVVIAEWLLKAGHVLNEAIPASKQYLDLGAIKTEVVSLDDTVAKAWTAARASAGATKKALPSVPTWLRDVLGLSYRDRLIDNLFELAAETYVQDLVQFVGSSGSINHGAESLQFRGLLYVIDDFEVLGPTLGYFLFGALAPRLEKFDFPTIFVIVGRDDFQASDPDWHLRYQSVLRAQISLRPFSEAQALLYLSSRGIVGSDATRLYAQSFGLPFLLTLLADAAAVGSSEGGDETSIEIARQFYDRTVRWMTAKEKQWVNKIVYLDKIDIDTLQRFFSPEESRDIQFWFERDGSLRDPKASYYTVPKIVRHLIVRYLSVRYPSEHDKTLAMLVPR